MFEKEEKMKKYVLVVALVLSIISISIAGYSLSQLQEVKGELTNVRRDMNTLTGMMDLYSELMDVQIDINTAQLEINTLTGEQLQNFVDLFELQGEINEGFLDILKWY